jgi:hypothetical protein
MGFATEINYVDDSTYLTYLVAVAVCGLLMVVLAAFGFGASVAPRLFSGALGLVFLGYGFWVAFIRPKDDVFSMYPVGFILPILVIGFVLYSRISNREIDKELLAERAKRIAERQAAARAAETETGTGGPPAT